MRYLDAYDSDNDNRAVTRPLQDNPSQWWYLARVEGAADNIFTIQKVGTNEGSAQGHFLDAYEDGGNDWRVVTRTAQNNPSQQWMVTRVGGTNSFTIQQRSNQRFLDAYSGRDWQVVTRGQELNDSQQWQLTPLSHSEEIHAQQLSASLGNVLQNPLQALGNPGRVLWPQHGEDNTRCSRGGSIRVNTQMECQERAMRLGHPFYHFRHHNGKCGTAASCDSPIHSPSSATNSAWQAFKNPDHGISWRRGL
jgi:hypothetical protein